MRTKKIILLSSLALFLVSGGIWAIFQTIFQTQTSVKGTQTRISTPSPAPSITPPPSLLPTLVVSPTKKYTQPKIYSPTVTPTISTKQKGGWYWRAELNKSQVWMGTDGSGNDIWMDNFPGPTATPTPFQPYSGGGSNTTTNTTVPNGYNTNSTVTTYR